MGIVLKTRRGEANTVGVQHLPRPLTGPVARSDPSRAYLVCGEDPELLTLADEWAVCATREAGRPDAFRSAALKLDLEVTGSVSPFHCLSGVHGAQAIVSNAMQDAPTRQRALDAFVAASRRPCDALDLTVGRAGTLLAAAILLEAVDSDRVLDTRDLRALGNATTETIWSQLDGMPPVGECGSLPYLGVAHGWAGLLLATLRWSRVAGACCRRGCRTVSSSSRNSPAPRGWGSPGA